MRIPTGNVKFLCSYLVHVVEAANRADEETFWLLRAFSEVIVARLLQQAEDEGVLVYGADWPCRRCYERADVAKPGVTRNGREPWPQAAVGDTVIIDGRGECIVQVNYVAPPKYGCQFGIYIVKP